MKANDAGLKTNKVAVQLKEMLQAFSVGALYGTSVEAKAAEKSAEGCAEKSS